MNDADRFFLTHIADDKCLIQQPSLYNTALTKNRDE